VPGAVFVGNAFGKLAGSTQVRRAWHHRDADRPHEHAPRSAPRWTPSIGWTLVPQPGNEQVRSVNALVGETNDGTPQRHPRRSP
jgi:D-aminopeptidase